MKSVLFAAFVISLMATAALASTASATTLETNGVKQSGTVSYEATLKGSWLMKGTSGEFLNTCVGSAIGSKDSTSATGTSVSGPITRLVLGTSCTHWPIVIHKAGSLSIEWIKGTTNGTLRLSDSEWTLPMTISGTVITPRCTATNVDAGTVTGAGSGGTTTIDFDAVINCGFFLPSTKWEGTFVVTGGHAIGVVE